MLKIKELAALFKPFNMHKIIDKNARAKIIEKEYISNDILWVWINDN